MGRENKSLNKLQKSFKLMEGGKPERDVISHRREPLKLEPENTDPPKAPKFITSRPGMINVFKMYVDLIKDAGVPVFKCHSVAIGRLAMIHRRILYCERLLDGYEKKTGNRYSYIVQTVNGAQQKKYQEVMILETAEKELRQYLRSFGLTANGLAEISDGLRLPGDADDPASRLRG